MSTTTEAPPNGKIVPPQGGTGGTTAVARQEPRAGDRGLQLTGLSDMWRFAQYVASSQGLAPKGMDKPESILVAIQLGAEIGLSPMQACQSIAVINGRPSIFGDAAKALVEGSGLCERYEQWFELDGKRLVTPDGYARTPLTSELKDSLVSFVLTKRKGRDPFVSTFSVEDARRANLWTKDGPWKQYPARMLMFRARGFNLRDNFGDVLKGLYTAEEAGDLAAAGPTSTERLHAKLAPPPPAPAGPADPAEVIEGESEPAETPPPPAETKPAKRETKGRKPEPKAVPAETPAEDGDGDPLLDKARRALDGQPLGDAAE